MPVVQWKGLTFAREESQLKKVTMSTVWRVRRGATLNKKGLHSSLGGEKEVVMLRHRAWAPSCDLEKRFDIPGRDPWAMSWSGREQSEYREVRLVGEACMLQHRTVTRKTISETWVEGKQRPLNASLLCCLNFNWSHAQPLERIKTRRTQIYLDFRKMTLEIWRMEMRK